MVVTSVATLRDFKGDTLISNEYQHELFVQVTIQVQEVELGGGSQRQGSFLSTPGGHRVLGKQLSADNAEMHR